MMKSLHNYIIEQLDTENVNWKVDVWMKNHPEEVAAFNKVMEEQKKWNAKKSK